MWLLRIRSPPMPSRSAFAHVRIQNTVRQLIKIWSIILCFVYGRAKYALWISNKYKTRLTCTVVSLWLTKGLGTWPVAARICEGIARRKPVLWRFPEGSLLRAAVPSTSPPRSACIACAACFVHRAVLCMGILLPFYGRLTVIIVIHIPICYYDVNVFNLRLITATVVIR